MLAWELRSHREAMALNGPVMMDRGIPDIVGYLTLCRLPIPAHIEAAAHIYPYNRHVFIAPYWDDIFTQDAERKQDKQEAKDTALIMAETYTHFGYQLIELPRTNIRNRADFIYDNLLKLQKTQSPPSR
jgi:predicted ATPase